MENLSNCQKARLVLLDRAIALTHEGYSFVVLTSTDNLFFAKLKHRTNGKFIVIKGYPKENVFSQNSNGYAVVKNAPILCRKESDV